MFRTTALLLALQTLLDVFLAPQQGTRWSDHLAAGLVPLTLLGVATSSMRDFEPGPALHSGRRSPCSLSKPRSWRSWR
jgi:hypothetical protein